MKKIMLATLMLYCGTSFAESAFTGIDYSGTYDCTGDDRHDGKFSGAITLNLVHAQSSGEYGSYAFKLDVPGFGGYVGHGAARGNHMALYFANIDSSTKDYGTGIVTIDKNKNGKWRFENFYFEPEYFGGNYGMENCVMR